MGPAVITMIVIGIIFICGSFFISEKFEKKDNDLSYLNIPNELNEQMSEEFTKEQLEKIRSKVDELLDNKSEEYIEKTNGELSKVSNEKIMAFHEYSEQVLDKIDQNHNEVVFLYDMLNNKEQELKDTIREVNNTKKELEDEKDAAIDRLTNLTQTMALEEQIRKEELERREEQLIREAQLLKEELQKRDELDKNKKELPHSESDSKDKSKRKREDNKPVHATVKKAYDVDTSRDDEVKAILDIDDYNEFVEQNNNEEILRMYEDGKSVLEISKKLGIGQGEVKLVINLYKGINRK